MLRSLKLLLKLLSLFIFKITVVNFIIIIISPLDPLLDKGFSFSPPCSIFGYSHPAPASRPSQIVTPPGLRASYTTFMETRSPLQNSFTPSVVGSTADMASPLPLQHANAVWYVSDFSSRQDHLVSDSIPQRNPEHNSFHSSLSDLELVDQPCRECPRFDSVCRDYHVVDLVNNINYSP
jgi:hypothetical protein